MKIRFLCLLTLLAAASPVVGAPVYNFHLQRSAATSPRMVGLAAAPDPAGEDAVWWRSQNGAGPGNGGNAILSNSEGDYSRIVAVAFPLVAPTYAAGFQQPANDFSVEEIIQREGFSFTVDNYPISIWGLEPTATYDLYVYGSRGEQSKFTLGGVEKIVEGTLKAEADPWVEGEHYVRFQGLTGSNTYTFTGAKGSEDRYMLTALQIVQTGGGSVVAGDNDGDGDVDGGDFLIWQRNFGTTSGGGAAASQQVPEPGAVSLIVCSCLAIGLIRRPWHR